MAVNIQGSGALQFEAVIENNQFKRQIDEMEKKLVGLTNAAQKEAAAIDGLVKNTAAAIASYATFASATDFVSQVVKVRGEFQQLEIAFTTMLKSKDAADKLMAQAVDLAARTPYTLQDVGGAAKQLLAYGFAAQNVTNNIEMLGNIASGVGAPLNDIVYLYGTLKTQGQVFTRDLLQFTARGIPLVAQLADQFGVAESEVKGMVEAGKVGFPDIERAFRSLTDEAGKFYDLTGKASKSLTGQLSNLQDAWSSMLDDIGKGNEGLLSEALGSAIGLVNNYEKVIDILKGLIATYGTYRAAIIATSAVTAIATSAAKGYTLAQTLQYQAMLISERVMKVLNATMLSNPFVAAASALTLLVGALIIFNNEAETSRDLTKEMADAQKEVTDEFEKQKSKIDSYANQLKKLNLTEEQRKAIYEKLKAISPDLVGGLNAQSLTYEKLIPNLEKYIGLKQAEIDVDLKALDKEKRDARKAEINEEIKLLEKRQQTLKNGTSGARIAGGSSFGVGNTGSANQQGSKDTEKKINDRLTALRDERTKLEEAILTDLSKPPVPPKVQAETLKYLQDTISLKEGERAQVSATSAEYKKYSKEIENLQRKVRAITGEKAPTNTADKASEKTKSRLTGLLEELTEAERAISNISLAANEAQIKAIEDKWDRLRESFKKEKADAGILLRVDQGEEREIGIARRQQRVNEYKGYLDQQAQAFQQFEDDKAKYGEDKAKELSDSQASEFENYVSFLKSQLALLKFDNSDEGKKKREIVSQALTDAEKAQIRKDTDFRMENLKRVLDATKTFNIKRKEIEEQYQNDVKLIQDDKTVTNKEERLAALKEVKDQELADLESAAARSSDIYKRLNEDILLFSLNRLKKEKEYLEKYLKDNAANITPELQNNIKARIGQIRNVIESAGKFAGKDAEEWEGLSQKLNQVSGSFGEMADALRDTNVELADTLQTMSDLTGVASGAASAIASFVTGGPTGIIDGITKSISVVVKVFKIFSDAKKSQKEAQKDMEAFQLKMLSSETDINVLYRQRMLDQIKINQLRLQGVQAESKLLKEQAAQNKTEFARIFGLLQKEQFISGKKEEKYGGFLGIGRKTRLVNTYSTLAGKTYEDLEKLFLSGQLEDRALELFKNLEKLKNEGVDIDAALAANAVAVKEIFTGTTAESIADSITEGFASGLRSAKDFSENFEQLMKGAILNALKYQTLEGPLKEFYDAFAANAESDGILTEAEIKQLRENFNGIIANAGARFDELKKITNVDFNNATTTAAQKGLAGAIRGITAEQADLLAGQFGGLRLTAIDHLKVSMQSVTVLNKIETNTSNLTVLHTLKAIWERLELNGIKVK